MSLIVWICKSLLILVVFHFVAPIVVDTHTRNSWIKLPIMLFLAAVAGVFMAWLHYVPYLLFFVWLSLTYRTLQAMKEQKFETEAGMRMNKFLFYISHYSYVVLSCLLAWFFQAEIVPDPSGPWMPLWRYSLGLK